MAKAIYEHHAHAAPLLPHHATMHAIYHSSGGADLFLGGYRTAHDQDLLGRHHISNVINCTHVNTLPELQPPIWLLHAPYHFLRASITTCPQEQPGTQA